MKPSVILSLSISALSALALVAPSTWAQPSAVPSNVMEMQDISQPPPGAVAPRPIGPRDVTMADYPRDSFTAGEEGRVRLRALVRSDGTVESATVEGSSGSERLDQAAAGLVRNWRYVPAMREGAPVAARFPVNIDWKLGVLPYGMPVSEALKFGAGSNPSVSAVARFLVGADGSVANATIQRSSGYANLDDAALKQIKTWHMKPATLRDGSPVSVWLRTPILFASSNNSIAEPAVHSDNLMEFQSGTKDVPAGIRLPEATTSHALRVEGYPVESIRRLEQGTVSVRYLVLEDGTVGDIELMKTSGHPRLDQAAFAQVANWLFKPATQANKPVPMWLRSNYVFQLR